MAADSRHSSLPEDATGQAPDYRSLSVWAMVGCGLGLLSFASLAHPSLWVVPFLAVLCSLVALARIRRDPDYLMGTRPALVGLSIGLFFLACAPVRYLGERRLLQGEAEAFFHAWLDAVRAGRLEEAYQGTLEPRYRQPVGTDLREFYRTSPDDQKDLESYFSFGVAKDLRDAGPQVTAVLDREFTVLFERDQQSMTHRWRVYRTPDPQAGDAPVLELQTRIVRSADDFGEYWQLVGLAEPNPPRGRKPRSQSSLPQP